jgi:hypothetical protein
MLCRSGAPHHRRIPTTDVLADLDIDASTYTQIRLIELQTQVVTAMTNADGHAPRRRTTRLAGDAGLS